MNIRAHASGAIGGVMILLGVTQPSMAQGGFGSIGGSAVDSSGAVLPGVTVTLSNPGTIGGNQVTTTDSRGTYQFPRLVPGRYSVKGELTGFRPVAVEDVFVNAQATARADFIMQLGEVQETVTVSGVAPLLDTTAVLNQTVMTREVARYQQCVVDRPTRSRRYPEQHRRRGHGRVSTVNDQCARQQGRVGNQLSD
jgi:hypothetical protein